MTSNMATHSKSMAMTRACCALLVLLSGLPAFGQEARRRWEMQRQIRLDKFEQVLPLAMRNAGIDMWIVAVKENHYDPLWEDLGRGYVTGHRLLRVHRSRRRSHRARGARAERLPARAVRRLRHLRARRRRCRRSSRSATRSASASTCRTRSARPTACRYTMHQHLVKTLGEPYASRLVSAEALVSEFRSRRVAAEIVAFGEAAGIAIQLAERALSNEVITPGKTTLEDVAWWLQDRLLERGLGSEFDMPSVYVTGPEGIVATSTDAHHPARRRDDDRLGRAADELRHRRQARRLRAEAGRDRRRRRASRTRSTRRSPSATCSRRRSSRACAPTRR